jgi:hypothetical protein
VMTLRSSRTAGSEGVAMPGLSQGSGHVESPPTWDFSQPPGVPMR